MDKYSKILNEAIKEFSLDEVEYKKINDILEKVKIIISKKINKKRISAEVFVGGSWARGTVVRGEEYDVDIFLRFSQKYTQKQMQKLTKKIISKVGKIKKVHGSRDYFQIKIAKNVTLEIIPVRKISKPEQAENITDLSYSHVKYINKKTNKKILNEIILAKAFLRAHGVYGAESYIRGFSGYSLELLILEYRSFIKMIRELSKVKSKIIIDNGKQFKKKSEALIELNESKLQGPIILIDPTYKYRNALAGLSEETFRKFQIYAKEFLKNPSIKSFEKVLVKPEEFKQEAKEKKAEFLVLKTKTSKQAGDIAGSKLLKFYNHLKEELSLYFEIINNRFDYQEKKKALNYFVLKHKKELIFSGPTITDKKNAEVFRKKHSSVYVKSGRLYSKIIPNISGKEFMKIWKKKYKKKIKAMNISNMKIYL